MFAVIGLILFVVAAIFELVGKHTDWVIWLIIISGLCYGIHMLWGWAPWRHPAPPA